MWQWMAKWLVPDYALMWPQQLIWWNALGDVVLLRCKGLHGWDQP